MTHPDVPAEQAHVDLAYARLAAMRAAAAPMLQDAFSERGGTFQAVTERDIRVRNSLNRLEQLEIGRESLVFGRIDRRAAEPTGQRLRAGDRVVPHRAARHLRPGPGAARGGLAGADRRALLPGDGRPSHGPLSDAATF